MGCKKSFHRNVFLTAQKLFHPSVLDRVQSFLPQMAEANDELRRGMESIPVREFDIEHVDDSVENIIEMVSGLFALALLQAVCSCIQCGKRRLPPCFPPSLIVSR